MASPSAGPAELGFVETAPSWRLRSEQFPSKVGGRPAWLSAAGLPRPPELACPLCGRPMAFLLQVYAPLPGRADAFHRCLFLFCCRTPPCCCGLRVFRNQLPRRNDFYSYEPPSEDPPSETGESVHLQLKSGAHLCRVCGCSGPKRCSRCHKAHYCSKDHQSLDWRLGHKQACAQTDNLDNTVPDHNFLFPEFEIVIETEDEIMPEVVERDDESQIIGSMGEAHEEELESMAKHESKEDKIFQKFKTKISLEPEQILRYGRGIAPLWISGKNIPQEKDIPDCPCGAKRLFEFQLKGNLRTDPKQTGSWCVTPSPKTDWFLVRDALNELGVRQSDSSGGSAASDSFPGDHGLLRLLSSLNRYVMPQLLNYLKVDRLGRSVDWGVLAVFTCAESCELGTGYAEEFVWKQDITDAA